MRRLALSLLAALGCAAAACSSSENSSDGSLQIDPVNGCVSGGNCKRDDADAGGSATANDAAAPTEDPTADPTPTPTTPPAATPTENTCQTATDLGQINGEHIGEGAAGMPITLTGTCSEWVQIRVKETSSWLSALGVDAKLTSAATQKFDLYGYVDTSADDLSCTTPYASASATLSPVADVAISWPDSAFSDDSRTVVFEVRSHDGKCPAGETWSLVVNNYVDVPIDTPPVTPEF